MRSQPLGTKRAAFFGVPGRPGASRAALRLPLPRNQEEPKGPSAVGWASEPWSWGQDFSRGGSLPDGLSLSSEAGTFTVSQLV